MMGTISYNGYEGTAEYDSDREVFRGKILFINDLVTYQAGDAKGLKAAFKEAVDDYLETCAEIGREPQKPFNGTFNVRISPERHRQAAVRAAREGTSLNDVVSKALDTYLNGAQEIHNHVSIHVESNPEMKPLQSTSGEVKNWVSAQNVQYKH